MTLENLNAKTRRRLRRHAWLLTIGCVGVGFATGWVGLHVLGVRAPAAPYGIDASVMYSLGLVVGALLVTGVVPALFMDGVAALLAEAAVQFVFGALIARRVIRPQARDAAFTSIVGKTWLAGLAFFVVSVSAGLLLGAFHPGGATVADLFR